MKTIARVIVVRDTNGNDVCDTVHVHQYQTMDEALTAEMHSYMLDLLNRDIVKQAKESIKWNLIQRIKEA